MKGTPGGDTIEPTFGELLELLSDLDRRGFEAEATQWRDRLEVVLREWPLEELYPAMTAMRVAAEALGRRA